jgi:hypothetical protein
MPIFNRLAVACVDLALGAFLFCAWTPIAKAAGNCPPGFYPVGGQGVQGCAPIPGGAATAANPAAPAPARPLGEWVKTWGAIAVSWATSDAGVSTGLRSKSAAEKEALSKCRMSGARDCSINMTYFNQCVSWAIPSGRSGGRSVGHWIGADSGISITDCALVVQERSAGTM